MRPFIHLVTLLFALLLGGLSSLAGHAQGESGGPTGVRYQGKPNQGLQLQPLSRISQAKQTTFRGGARALGGGGTPSSPGVSTQFLQHLWSGLGAPLNQNAPDATIAAGPDRIVTAVSDELRVTVTADSQFGRKGDAFLIGLKPFLGQNLGTRFVCWPRLVFVPRANPFPGNTGNFVLAVTVVDRTADSPQPSIIALAVSNNDHPTASTFDWGFAGLNTFFQDAASVRYYSYRPHLGWDNNALYLTWDTAQFDAFINPASKIVPALSGNRVLAIQKNFVTGGTARLAQAIDVVLPGAADLPAGPYTGTRAWGLRPAESMGSQPRGLIMAAGRPNNPQDGNGITAYIADFAAFPAPVLTLTPRYVANPASRFTSAANAGSAGAFRQVSTGYTDLTKAVLVNDVLWTSHCVGTNFDPQARVRVYQLNLNNGTGTVGLRQFNDITDPGQSLFAPVVVPDTFGNAVAYFNGSSFFSPISLQHARYVGITSSFEPISTSVTSLSSFSDGFWGAYNDAAPDVLVGGRVWAHGELASSDFTWETRVALIPSRATTVITPNGGEAFLFGEPVQVCWTPGISLAGGVVGVQISRDGGLNWSTVAENIADAAGQFTFIAAGPASTRTRVRVIAQTGPSTFDANFFDASDGDFTITDGIRSTFCIDDEVPVAPLVIPDNWRGNADWAISPLFFPADMIVRGISTQVEINHGFQQDLQIYLLPPDAPIPQDIANSNITTNDLALYGIKLQDQSGGTTPFATTVYPIPQPYAEPLASARAKVIPKRSRFWDPTGRELPWRLVIRDLKGGNAGSLTRWCLTLTGPQKQRLIVTYPNGGERLDIGSAQQVTWTNDSDNPISGDVNLYLALDGVTFGNLPINPNPIPADVQFFDWITPNTPTATARIQVRSTSDLAQVDASDGTFTIEPPSLTVISPNGGETLVSGKPATITWDSVPLSGSVTIKLSTDSGVSYPTTIIANAPNVGSYIWQVPANLVTTTARIQVTANSGPARTDNSNADFSVRQQSITVTSPNAAGILWYTVNPQTITWSSTGLTGNVRIELSRVLGSGGIRTDWELLGTPAVAAGTFAYTPTAPGTTTALIRITSATDSTVSDVSDNVFEIREARITVTSPVAGDKWAISFPYTITWTTEGLPIGQDRVDIQISRNSSPFVNLFTDVANSGAQSWTVTGPQRDNCIIRVVARSVPISGVSGTFAVVGASVALTDPNGGERVAVGRNYSIRWTAIPPQGTVTLRLSRNSGLSYDFTIATGVPNNGRYDWLVPTQVNGQPIDTTTARVLIEVDGSPFPAQTDFSNADFTIETPRVTVLYPNGGEIWYTHTTETIRYQTVGVTGTVEIQISRAQNQDGSRTDWTTVGFAPASPNGTFPYTVAGPAANNVAVRVRSASDATAQDVSDSAFVIREMSLTLGTPNGGEVWGVGTQRTITWQHAGVPGNVSLLLSTNGGASFNPLVASTANDGTERITVPNIPSTNCILKVQAEGFPPFDVSDAVFTIVAAQITVVQPNGGEEFRVGQTYTLEWNSAGLAGNVRVELVRGGAVEVLYPSEPSNGTRSWVATGPDTANARLRIVSLELPSVQDESDAPFTIVTPAITVLSPNGGERWFVGSSQTVNWSVQGIDNSAQVRIEISRGNGPFEELIAATENDGTADVTVPGPPSNSVRLRITALDGTGAADTSDSAFTILNPTLRLLSPNGGLEWLTGSRQTISWTSDGVPTDALINVYLLGPGKSDSQLIIAQTLNDGSESWTVEGATAGTYRVRIEWVGRPEVADTGDGDITISAPQLRVTSPSAGGKWIVGRLVTIRWEGSVVRVGGGQVDILISRDGGRSYQTLVQDTRNDGSLTLTAVGPAKKARIRVIWKPNPAVQSTSGNFQIVKPKARR